MSYLPVLDIFSSHVCCINIFASIFVVVKATTYKVLTVYINTFNTPSNPIRSLFLRTAPEKVRNCPGSHSEKLAEIKLESQPSRCGGQTVTTNPSCLNGTSLERAMAGFLQKTEQVISGRLFNDYLFANF